MKRLPLLVVALGCALRLLSLAADPDYYGWAGHLKDEGRWVEHARALVLQGRLFQQEQNHHLVIAPGFAAASYVSFALFGVNRTAARLVPALAGILILLLLHAHLRRRIGPAPAALALALVAFQADLVVLSRIALPDLPALAALLVSFLLLFDGEPRSARRVAAGVATAAALAIKATVWPLVPIFALALLADRSAAGGGPGARIRAVGEWAAGWLACALAGVTLSAPLWLPHAGRLAAHLRFASRFLGLVSPYTLFARPFEEFGAPVLNLLLLALWGAGLGVAVGARADEPPASRRAMRAAWIWAGLMLFELAVQSYAPLRYRIQVLVPAAVLVGYAAERLERAGTRGWARAWAERSPLGRTAVTAWLVAPSALLLAAAAATALARMGVAALVPERLRAKLLFLLVSEALTTVLAWRAARSRSGFSVLIGFPVAALLAWVGLWLQSASAPHFWPATNAATALAPWAVAWGTGAVGALVALALASWPRPWKAPPASALATAAWSALWLAHLVPGMLHPSYSVRDASRDLGRVLARAPEVAVSNCKGLIIDNRLRFRGLEARRWEREAPEFVVALFPFPGDEHRLLERYRALKRYDIHLPATYKGVRPRYPSGPCRGVRGRCVVVLRRRPLEAAATKGES